MRLKVILLLLFSMTMLFAVEAKATCPDGYTPGAPHTFYYNGCEVTIYYCWMLDPQSGDLYTTIDGIDIDPNCAPSITIDNSFWHIVDIEMSTVVSFFGAFFPACPEFYLYWHEYSGMCWAIENIPEDPIHGVSAVCKLVDCNSSVKCIERYKVCYNAVTKQVEFEFYDRDILGQPNCNSGYPQLPPPGKTWYQYWISECALLNACAM
jgi:hypothetical protein